VLAATNLADQVKLQAVVDGSIPFSVAAGDVEIRQGMLNAVGGGRLTICRSALGAPAPAPGLAQTAPEARAADACPSAAVASNTSGAAAADGVAQEFAYQALEDLAFESLDARLNTLPNDRLGVIFHIKGRHDPPRRRKAVIRLLDVIRGRALARPLDLPSDTKIDLTLDTSLNFGELIRALAASWRDASVGPESAASGKAPPAAGEAPRP
jgi:hypothetical protein